MIGWFFGSLKSGGYESRNDGFLTDEERGERDALEIMRRRKEEREGRKAELEQLLFDEWLESKSDEELTGIAEPPLGMYIRGKMHRVALMEHFREKELEGFKKVFFSKNGNGQAREESAAPPN